MHQFLATMTQASAEHQSLSLHFLALCVAMPSEGCPVLTDWLRVAGDLWHGFENWRDAFETVAIDDQVLGKQQRPGMLQVKKGIGRASIILFGVYYSFHVLKESMSPEETADFQRWGLRNMYLCISQDLTVSILQVVSIQELKQWRHEMNPINGNQRSLNALVTCNFSNETSDQTCLF